MTNGTVTVVLPQTIEGRARRLRFWMCHCPYPCPLPGNEDDFPCGEEGEEGEEQDSAAMLDDRSRTTEQNETDL